MSEKSSKYLSAESLKTIASWIHKVEKYRYEPKKEGDTKAWKKLKLPYKAMDAGLNRIVYDLKTGFVLKIALSVKGISDNNREVMIYKYSTHSTRKHIAQIKEYGYGWIIMKKYNDKVPKTKKNTENVFRLKSKFLEKGINPKDIIKENGKRKPRWKNFRLKKKEEIIVIDYGSFRQKK